MLENFVLPMGRNSSHETLKVTSVVYKRHFNENLRTMFGVGRRTKFIVTNDSNNNSDNNNNRDIAVKI